MHARTHAPRTDRPAKSPTPPAAGRRESASSAPHGSPVGLRAAEILHLQRTIGNRAVAGMLRGAVAREPASRVGMLDVRPPEPAAAGGPELMVQRLWDVVCKAGKNFGGQWIIENIVISDRPPNPDTTGFQQHGGTSFHHESAWTLVEKQVTQFIGVPIQEAVAYLVKYGLTGSAWPPMDKPGNDGMEQLDALNRYFHHFLETKAAEAQGWLGSKEGHSSQGGKISGALRSLRAHGFTDQVVTKLLDVSFEPGPGMDERQLSTAAEFHAHEFYAAFQRELEDEGPNAISEDDHEGVLEAIRTWTTKYWVEPQDF